MGLQRPTIVSEAKSTASPIRKVGLGEAKDDIEEVETTNSPLQNPEALGNTSVMSHQNNTMLTGKIQESVTECSRVKIQESPDYARVVHNRQDRLNYHNGAMVYHQGT